jgi:signal transduction histidine kinase
MGLDVSLEQLAALYQVGALGKLINGLIHNLNGPLQNLSMDLEMMEHSVRTARGLPADLAESLLRRLKRMGGEFDHISGLIRAASMRAGAAGSTEQGDLRTFLEQELSFLNTNLYFKHNVQKEVLLEEGLPPLVRFPAELGLALGWFLQSLVEEIEREKVPSSYWGVKPMR